MEHHVHWDNDGTCIVPVYVSKGEIILAATSTGLVL